MIFGEKGYFSGGGVGVKGGIFKFKFDGLEGKEGKDGKDGKFDEDKFYKDFKVISLYDKNVRGFFDKNKKEVFYDN